MKMNRTISAVAGLGLTVLSAQADLAHAAEIKVWTARAIATVLAEVGPQLARRIAGSLGLMGRST
jgi:hypothetical protein